MYIYICYNYHNIAMRVLTQSIKYPSLVDGYFIEKHDIIGYYRGIADDIPFISKHDMIGYYIADDIPFISKHDMIGYYIADDIPLPIFGRWVFY